MESKFSIKILLHLWLSFLTISSLLHRGDAVYVVANDARPPWNGSLAELLEELMGSESEITRRFLADKKYISVDTLKKDQPVCDEGGRGEAYTKSGSCTPPPSNPYNRGCSKYYRCRS